MSKYAEKITAKVINLNKSIVDATKQVASYKTKLEKINSSIELLHKSIAHLEQTLDQEAATVSVNHLRNEIVKLEVEAGRTSNGIEYYNERITAYKLILDIFAKNFCPHESVKYSHTDHHGREDYYRCDLCGSVI